MAFADPAAGDVALTVVVLGGGRTEIDAPASLKPCAVRSLAGLDVAPSGGAFGTVRLVFSR
jgi:hypothetical protein